MTSFGLMMVILEDLIEEGEVIVIGTFYGVTVAGEKFFYSKVTEIF